MRTFEYFLEAIFDIIVVPCVFVLAVIGAIFCFTANDRSDDATYIAAAFTDCTVSEISVTRLEEIDHIDSYLVYDCNNETHRVEFTKASVTFITFLKSEDDGQEENRNYQNQSP